MATINTRLILRSDKSSEWKDSEFKFKAGEVGLEFLQDENGNLTGKVKMKVASENDTTWDQMSYVGGDEAKVIQVNDSLDNITETELHAGDIAVVKTQIGETGKYSYTAYVYNGSDWEAMDGNYSAKNVFLNSGITLTSAVGNYTKNHTINAGTSLEDVLSGLLQKEEEPGTPSKPTAEITASGGTGEVGTEYTVPTATLKINSVGSYTYGPATGIVFNAGDIKLAEGADPTTSTNYKVTESAVNSTGDKLTLKASGDKVKYTDSAVKYTFSGSASYQAATAGPVTNLGNPSKTQSAITAGSCTIADKEVSFSGWRRMFMGNVSKTAEMNSTTIKTATLISKEASKTTQEFTAPVGAEKIIIAFPRSKSTSAPAVKYFTMSWEDFGDFTLEKEKVKVSDASGTFLPDTNTADEYMVYSYTPADPLKADTKFQVTLK